MISRITQLNQNLSPLISQITHHPLYSDLSSIHNLQYFMEQHVFAVWDFMCLLKELYRRLVCTSAPWFPPKDALSANLIASILVEEEGDITDNGTYASHFEIYLTAMEKVGANTNPIRSLLSLLMNGLPIEEAIKQIEIQPATKDFVLTTFNFFNRPLHELAAAFVYGREGITSVMFMPMLKKLESSVNQQQKSQLSTLMYYFKRHITLDNSEHFPKALNMLSNLIDEDEQKFLETEQAAIEALMARIHFLTSIHERLIQNKENVYHIKNYS